MDFGGNIDLERNVLHLKKLSESLDLKRSPGGHVVISLESVIASDCLYENVEQNECKNVTSLEADRIMLLVFAEIENVDSVSNFHETIGHHTFVSLGLTDDEEAQVKKVHKYFGHRSGRRIWELFAKADKLRGKKQAVLDLISSCKICSELRKAPPRPKVGLPVANDFNEIVGIDLKVLDKGKGHYILWIMDIFSKLIKGRFIKNKEPATIIENIIQAWIIGDGTGPGHPKFGFYSDNGGEFINEEVLDFASSLNIGIKVTSANAPWQNGVVERQHATVDILYDKIVKENPGIKPQEAINQAAFAKNSEINETRFSPLLLMMGQNPHFPGLEGSNPASTNLDSCNKYMKTLKTIDFCRVKYREVDCDTKIKKVMSQKLNPNVEKSYRMGEPVFFYEEKKKQWKKGTALLRFGKTVYLKYGNFLRRVPVDKVRHDEHGEQLLEEGYIDPDEGTEEKEQFRLEVTNDITEDIELAEENTKLKRELSEQKRINELEKEKVLEGRKAKRRLQKLKKQEDKIKLPVIGQFILFKEKNGMFWMKGRVVSGHKRTSKYKNRKQIMLADGKVVERDFCDDIEEWKVVDEVDVEDDQFKVEEELSLSHHQEDYSEDNVFPVKIIPPSHHHT